MTIFFGRHVSQISAIFWEGIITFFAQRCHLLTGGISASFIQDNALQYALATYAVSEALDIFIVFNDGITFGIPDVLITKSKILYSTTVNANML